MKSYTVLFICCFAFFAATHAQDVKSTNEILEEAYQQAAKENKNVFVMFHASWCTWCHKMDTAMNDKTCKEFFDKNYVIEHLVIFETAKKKHLENPGALELLRKYNGDNQGIPYWIIFDKEGKILADSKIRPEGAGLDAKGENSGCPATKEEVAHFIKVLKATSNLNEEQLLVIEKRFIQNGN